MISSYYPYNIHLYIYIYKSSVSLCIILKHQNYLTDYVSLWINLFVTFTGEFVAYSVLNIFSQNVCKILPILSRDMLQL